MSLVNQSRVDEYVERYKGATKAELRANIKRLKTKPKTTAVQAEIKAIEYLLS